MGDLLKNRVAIITGSGQGIGRELALWMAQQGCRVVVNNRKKGSSVQAHEDKIVKLNEEDLAKISKIIGDCEGTAQIVNSDPEVQAAGGAAIPVYADVCKDEDCKKLVDAAIDTWGRIDIVINNAAATWTGNVKEMQVKNWEVCVRSKLDSCFYLVHWALPYMVKQGYGRILICSSEAQVGLEGMCGYSAACGGVAALARAWSQDLIEDGISVNAYTPNAGTRSWFNMLAEYREEGYDVEAIEEGSPAAQKFPPDRMVPVLGYMCSEEFDATGLIVSVCADGEIALWDNLTKYNVCSKDLWAEGKWTIEDLRDVVPNQLLKNTFFQRSSLAVNKSSYE